MFAWQNQLGYAILYAEAASSSGSPAWRSLGFISKCLPWALRLQLASFYLTGLYYQWTHRLTGMLNLPHPFEDHTIAAVSLPGGCLLHQFSG